MTDDSLPPQFVSSKPTGPVDPDLASLENRLRSDLPDLAEALTAADESTGTRDTAVTRSPGSRRTLQFIAAAVAAVLLGGGALWASGADSNQIEAALNGETLSDDASDDSSDDETRVAPVGEPGWSVLPEVAAEQRAHMVSVWTGSEALFWGGRTDIGGADDAEGGVVMAFSGGVAYNPETGQWRTIAAPEWGHPGAQGFYNDGWVYVLAKGSVTRFDPVTGEEQAIEVPAKFGQSLNLTTAEGRVWVIGTLNRGPVAIPVDSATGQLAEDEVAETVSWPSSWSLFSDQPDQLVEHDGDMYVVSNGSVGRIAGQTGQSTILVGPNGVPEPGDLRVYAGDSRLGVVSVDGDVINVGRLDDRDSVEWFETQIEVESAAAATIVAAGDWLTVLPNSESAVSVNLVTGEQITHVDGPLAGYANANAVWTGRQLVVWGGQGDPAVNGGAPGARWVPPIMSEEPEEEALAEEEAMPEVPTSQELADAEARLAELPLEQRVDFAAAELGEYDAVLTDEGSWLYSRPQVDPGDPLRSHGEIILVRSETPKPGLVSWLMPLNPAGFLAVGTDAVYCLGPGDGGLPDTVICRIDRDTGEMVARVWPAEDVGSVYEERGWTVEEPWFPNGQSPDWSSIASSDRGLIVGGLGEWMLLDADDLSTIDLVSTEVDQRVTACPLLTADFELVDQPDLPEAVAAARQAIFDAAMDCDFDRLSELGAQASTSFDVGTFEQNLDLRLSGGGARLVQLVQLLNQPFASRQINQLSDEPQPNEYVWPAAFVDDPDDGFDISEGELSALSEIYDTDARAEIEELGGYYYDRVGIDSDGTWSFFIDGD